MPDPAATVLVTGASSGLGRALALRYGARGCRVVVTARRAALLDEVAAAIDAAGGTGLAVAADATDARACRDVLATAIEAFGPIDLAILNAGGGQVTDLASATSDEVMAMMRRNVDTLVHFLCPLIDHLRERGGTIAYTCSPAGFVGLPRSGPYSAAKAAGRVLLESARIDLAHTPIRFVTLYPGFTATEAFDASKVPLPGLVISEARAVDEMLWAIDRTRSHHLFPRRIGWAIRLARLLPEAVRRRILVRLSPPD